MRSSSISIFRLALLGTAAHLDGMGCSVLDQTGVSQKNGAVMSHVRLSRNPDGASGTRIGTVETEPREMREPTTLPAAAVTETAALTSAMSTTVRATRR